MQIKVQSHNQREYIYQEDSLLGNGHAYLLNSLMTLISKFVTSIQSDDNSQKLRLLDLGYGNGALSHFLAQQGFDVVGIEESSSGIELATKSFPDFILSKETFMISLIKNLKIVLTLFSLLKSLNTCSIREN